MVLQDSSSQLFANAGEFIHDELPAGAQVSPEAGASIARSLLHASDHNLHRVELLASVSGKTDDEHALGGLLGNVFQEQSLHSQQRGVCARDFCAQPRDFERSSSVHMLSLTMGFSNIIVAEAGGASSASGGGLAA